MHHRITVQSSLGKGSCFSINLPLTRKHSHVGITDESRPALPTGGLKGKRILLLDDDDSVLASMSGLLARWGCEVIAARSDEQVMQRLADCNQNLDLLISDYRLADGVSDINVARNMLHRLDYRLGVLVITGDTDPERLREAEESGFPLLHKPVHPAKLRATLQYLLGKNVD